MQPYFLCELDSAVHVADVGDFVLGVGVVEGHQFAQTDEALAL